MVSITHSSSLLCIVLDIHSHVFDADHVAIKGSPKHISGTSCGEWDGMDG